MAQPRRPCRADLPEPRAREAISDALREHRTSTAALLSRARFFPFDPPGVDGQPAALANELIHQLVDLAEILRDLAEPRERGPEPLRERIPPAASSSLMRPSAAWMAASLAPWRPSHLSLTGIA
jgi:hypothetical protein